MEVVFLKNLKTIRNIKGHTIRSLAAAIGSTSANISWLENLKHGAEPYTVRNLCDALGVEPEDLIGDGESYEKFSGEIISKPKRGRGRPSGTKKAESRRNIITLRLSEEEYEKYSAHGDDAADWLRGLINEAAV